MAALAQGTRRKLSLLHLAQELQNVSKACRIMGSHRDTFYEVRRAFQVGGVAALVEQRRGPRGPHPNRVAEDIEAKILAYALEHPTHGAQRVANELRLQNVNVGISGVRGVWSRHDLETRLKRRMEELEQEKQLSPLPPVAVGGSLVIPRGLLERLRGERRAGEDVYRKMTERVERLDKSCVRGKATRGREPHGNRL